jgi:hypothetical protein
LDEQFARDVKEAVYRRGLKALFISSSTFILRPKRVTRVLVRFDGTVDKVNKKDKGKGRQM